MRCENCGSQIDKNSEFCQKCGAAIVSGCDLDTTIALSPVEIEEEERHVEIPLAEHPALIVKKGPFVGQKFELRKDLVTLGRDPGSDIFLDDVTVSRNHARINVSGQAVTIEDVGSLNGTYVNCERIEEPIRLRSDDELQIGKYKLLFLSNK